MSDYVTLTATVFVASALWDAWRRYLALDELKSTLRAELEVAYELKQVSDAYSAVAARVDEVERSIRSESQKKVYGRG